MRGRGGRARGFFWGSGARLVRSVCTSMSSSVGGIILTRTLFTVAQSELARVDNCWRSCRGCPGGEALGRRGPMHLSTKVRVAALSSTNLMVDAKADRHGGERVLGERGGAHARVRLRLWCAARPFWVHACHRVREASSSRMSSSSLRSRQKWRTSSSHLSSISSTCWCGLDADGSEITHRPAQLGLAHSILLEMMHLARGDGGIGEAGCDHGRFCTQLVVRLVEGLAEDAPRWFSTSCFMSRWRRHPNCALSVLCCFVTERSHG